MKVFERVLIKLAIIQFVFLIIFQVFFHQLNYFSELKKMTQYEGVTENNHSKIIETFHQP